MKIALTGARGEVGQHILKYANRLGHHVYEINRRPLPTSPNSNPLSTHRRAEGTDYEQVLEAFKDADAVIHVAAIPRPYLDRSDVEVHNGNVQASYVALRAAAELKINRVCMASSVNALGLEYSRSPTFASFPIDETSPTNAEDPYALSKYIAEIQADAICRRYEDMRVASIRMHQVKDLEHLKREERVDMMCLWSWVAPEAVARACLLSVTNEHTDWKRGHERFYCVAPNNCTEFTRGSHIESSALAAKHFPNVPVTRDLSEGFFNTDKLQKVLGWSHPERE